MRPIAHFHLEHGRTTGYTGVLATNRITTLSVLLQNPSAISSLESVIDSLPTVPRLRALHVEVARGFNGERKVISSATSRLLRAVKRSLIIFHLTTETFILRDEPPILPKLQRFRLKSSFRSLDSIEFERWQLPSLQYLETSLDPLADQYVYGKLAATFGAQLRSFSPLHARYLNWSAFWVHFPTLASLHVQGFSWHFIAPPIDHPMRELVLNMQPGYSRRAVQALILEFVGVADQHSQGSNLASISDHRKVVLDGLKWKEDCPIMSVMLSSVHWERIAAHVEDELGETLASATTRFSKDNRRIRAPMK
jgi:hypothetical protein